MPDRRDQVAALVTGKYASLLDGSDEKGREVTRLVCGDLNLLDGGQWGLLIKNDRNPPFIPYDVLVWAPTREHIDMLSGRTPLWINNGPLPSPNWNWLACPPGIPTVPGPIITPPPPLPQGIDPVVPLAIEIQRLANEIYKLQVEHEMAEAAERAKAEAFRQAVGHEWAKFGKFFAERILPILGGAAAVWWAKP